MVLDSSVLAAIPFREADRDVLIQKIAGATRRYVTAAAVLETVIVYVDREPGMSALPVYQLLEQLKTEIKPVTAEHADIACQAFLRFGKGRHPAKLNFGDCFSYALAKSLDVPLLFKGEDFGLTDIRVA